MICNESDIKQAEAIVAHAYSVAAAKSNDTFVTETQPTSLESTLTSVDTGFSDDGPVLLDDVGSLECPVGAGTCELASSLTPSLDSSGKCMG